MAELNNAPTVNRSYGSPRSKTISTKVDLTAMVDLAFLLITFFMLTTTLTKQKQMELTMPVDGPPQGVEEKRTMTISLGKDDQLQWFMGDIEKPFINPSVSGYSQIRKTILNCSQVARNATGKHLIVLIKPAARSKYKNLVDILDEMAITKVQVYSICNLSARETEAMEKAGIL